ncbi:MAG: tRNA (cytidine(56)-2'-O)-methyltransferase [Nanoarchaeota archaeon]|nr:tRNA (cytidine(56)-2'-O)-methyltransferase [Nanoarchaeota archaeon]
MIEVLRLSHRIRRDIRLSTHVALTSRAFKADKIYYSGQKDSSLENSIKKLNFPIEYVKSPTKLIKESKSTIIHLTMKGDDYKKIIPKLKNENLLIIVGSEKVPVGFYKLANYNISVTKFPHSEAAALAVFLENLKNLK